MHTSQERIATQRQHAVSTVRIWPQKSGLFRVSTTSKPSTLFRVERIGVTRWKRSLSALPFRNSMHPRKMVVRMCIVKLISFTPRSKAQNEVFPPFVLKIAARPLFRYKQDSRLAYVPRKSGGIALINGACHLDKGHSTICMTWPEMLICPLLARLWTSRPRHATNARTIYTVLKIYGFFYVLPT
jgi:hypothetical protein